MFFLVEPSHFHHCVPLAPLSASFPNPATRAGYGFTYNNFLEDLSFGSFVFSPFTTNGSQAMSFVTSPSSTAFVLAQQGSGVRHLGCFFRVTWIGVQLVGGGVRLFATGIELTFHDGRGAFHSFYSAESCQVPKRLPDTGRTCPMRGLLQMFNLNFNTTSMPASCPAYHDDPTSATGYLPTPRALLCLAKSLTWRHVPTSTAPPGLLACIPLLLLSQLGFLLYSSSFFIKQI